LKKGQKFGGNFLKNREDNSAELRLSPCGINAAMLRALSRGGSVPLSPIVMGGLRAGGRRPASHLDKPSLLAKRFQFSFFFFS